MNYYRFFIVLILYTIVVVHSNDDEKVEKVEKAKGFQSKFNKKIDVNKIEKSWEKGDEEEELENEMKPKKKKNKKSKDVGFDPKQFAAKYKKDPLSAGAGAGSGPIMLFVELIKLLPSGESWKKKDVDNLAAKWTSVIKSGSFK